MSTPAAGPRSTTASVRPRTRRPEGRLGLELEAQADADLPRPADDRKVVAPRVARVEPAVDVELVEQVLAPELDAEVARRRLIDQTRVEDAVGGLEHRVAVLIDLRA